MTNLDEKQNQIMPENLITVIIPTKNSSRTIKGCLESIRNQTYKNIEILVIDAISSDNTCEIVCKYDTRMFSLEGERTKAKNFGISKAKGKFLFFIDSDMVLEKNVIEECVQIENRYEKLNGVVIPEHSIGSSFWVKVRDFERSLYAGSKIESPRFYQKGIVDLVGGFDEDIISFEESTISYKLYEIGIKKIVRINHYIFHDEEGFSFRRWLKKKKYYQTTSDLYSKKYPKLAKFQFSVKYRLKIFTSEGRWKILLKHPILTIGLIILKSSEYLATKL